MKKILFLAIAALSTLTLAAQSYKFDFGAKKPAHGYTKISPYDKFNDDQGYGFDIVRTPLYAVSGKGSGVGSSFITANAPFFFSVNVPDGNYRVRVTLGRRDGVSRTTIKAESRRLMELGVETRRGQTVVKEFTVNVRNSVISNGEKVKLKEREIGKLDWDNKLTLEFNDSSPAVCALEIERVDDVRTVFLCGNSTVVDQDSEPWCGWGQVITMFFDPNVSIANYAESGEAANTFIVAGRLKKILTQAKKGDYIFIEFGHNDQKQRGEGVGAFTTYQENLRKFIVAARNQDCIPVLVTPMHRRGFDDAGKVKNSLGDFPEAVRKLAAEEGVTLIDLNNMSATLYEAMGVDGSIKAFVHYPANTFPGQSAPLADNTHFNTYGGIQIAKCIVEGIRANIPELAKYIRNDYTPFNPAKPDNPTFYNVPQSPFVNIEKPLGS